MLCTVVRSSNFKNPIHRTVRYIFALAIVDSPNHSWFHCGGYFVKLAMYSTVWTSSHSLQYRHLGDPTYGLQGRGPLSLPGDLDQTFLLSTIYDCRSPHLISRPVSCLLLWLSPRAWWVLCCLTLKSVMLNFHISIWMIFWLICLYRG